MKKLAIIFLLITACQAICQEYQVLQLKGEIVRIKDGSLLKPGDKLDASEEIKFKTKDAMAAVLSSEKGRYILRVAVTNKRESDFIYILKSAVSPVRGGMSTRAGGINNAIDLQLYFAEAPYVWAGHQIKLNISSLAFPMNDKQFFFIRYELTDEIVNKKLDFDDEELIIDKQTLFRVDGNPINPDHITSYQLYYYNAREEESQLITGINFVLIDMKTLETLYTQYEDTSDDVYYDIADMLSDLYGKCDPLQLRINLLNQ